MLKTLNIKAFRGFSNLEVSGIERFSVVLGDNGAGKTSLLEAALTIQGRFAPLFIPALQAHRGLDEIHAERGVDMTGIFHGFAPTGEFEIGASDESGRTFGLRVHNKTIGETRPINGGGLDTGTQPVAQFEAVCSEDGQEFQPVKAEMVRNEQGRPAGLRVVGGRPGNPSLLLHPPGDMPFDGEDATRLLALENDLRVHEVVKSLQLINSDLIDLRFAGSHVRAQMRGIDKLVPLGLLGGGAVNLLRALAAIHSCRGGWMGWDEMENGFHYSRRIMVYRAIAEAARSSNVQMMMTTHSLEAARDLAQVLSESIEEDFCAIHLKREVGGSVKAISIPGGAALSSFEAGYELR